MARISGPCLAAGTLAVFAALVIAALLHRFRNARFASALFRAIALLQIVAALWVLFSGRAPLDTRLFPVALPVAAYVCVLSFAAAAFASRLRPSFAAAFTAALAVLSMFSALLPGTVQTVAGAFAPDFRNFWLADALSYTGSVPWRYSLAACGAAAILSAVWFAVGCLAFRTRDIN